MLPKYLIADVDDTFTVEGTIYAQALLAVKQAASAGIDVIFNTGRPAGFGATLLAYVDGLSAVVVENGGAWIDGQGAADRHEAPITYTTLPADNLRHKLMALAERVAARAGLTFVATADNAFRLTDYTVVRALPKGADSAALLASLRRYVIEESDGLGELLASSIHLHFMLDGKAGRSKAKGVAALLRSRGVVDVDRVLAQSAVAVGDSANDVSLFTPGRFALSVGVRNIERYLPELGAERPGHITRAAEGLGFCELVEDLLAGRLL